jgi:hypothetical protein
MLPFVPFERHAFIRARIRAYTAASHTCDIEPIGAPSALLSAVPVLSSVPAAELVVGRTVAVLLWPDVDALILGAFGDVPTPGDHDELSGLSDDDHTQYLNETRHGTTTLHELGTVVDHDSHTQLSDIAADDHHAKSHNHDTASGSGQIVTDQEIIFDKHVNTYAEATAIIFSSIAGYRDNHAKIAVLRAGSLGQAIIIYTAQDGGGTDGQVTEAARFTFLQNLLLGTSTDGMTAGGSIAIAQDLAHRGTHLGFYNTAPAHRPAHIANPSGGATTDAEARSAINSILSALETLGLIASS